jgi:calcineurin-like phosphoesterase family protein
MTHKTFFISDTHFGHDKCCTDFKMPDGVTPLRPFASAEEMDEEMVKRWNDVVRPHDKVYHLGDVVIARRNMKTLGRLNGKKRLVRGNHDIFNIKDYLEHFDDIQGVRILDGMILSHIPLRLESITERYRTNVHGHLHAHVIDNPMYFNVSVEQINFTPIELPDLKAAIEAKRARYPDYPYPTRFVREAS